jgi:formamidopyrimidine-DNA glycosylase
MPELPEVETVRRRLAPALTGRTFERVEIADTRLTRPFDPIAVAAELEGERVVRVRRRGKYLLLEFESGRVLLVHLRMTGSFHVAAPGSLPDDPHRRALITLDDGSDVAYRDVRRFGTWLLLEPKEIDGYLGSRVGEEPLEHGFSARDVVPKLSRRRAPVKAILLDQRVFAGMGNIYADEALWRARIHPLRPANEIADDELRRLVRAVRDALKVGIARQGSTISTYRQPDGAPGRMQHEFKVYGRTGEPCERCGTPIEKIRVAGRGTSYCPSCQPYAASGSSAPALSSRQSSV